MRHAGLFGVTPRRVAFVVVPGLVVAGCGIVAPQSQVQAPPTIDRSVLTTSAARSAVGPLVTSTVRRGTIHDVLNVPGRVVASRSAQLSFGQAGTISGIDVRSGQPVSKNDPLAELTLDAAALEAARSRAAAADLTYDTQLARISELQTGSSAQALPTAEAAVVKAQTDLGRAQIGRDALQQDSQVAQQTLSAARAASDRQVALGELAVQQAQDELAQAQDELARVQDMARTNGTGAPSSVGGTPPSVSSEAVAQAQDQAAADVATAAAAQRAASRKAQQTALDLQTAQSKPNERKVTLDLQDARAALARADRDLKDAQRETERPDRSKDPTGVLAAAAADKVRAAGRDYEVAQAAVARLQDEIQVATLADQRAMQLAQIAVDQAQDEFAQASAVAERADRMGQRIVRQARSGNPQPSATPGSTQPMSVQDPVGTAQARVRGAERQVESAQLKLQEAHSTQATSQADTETKAKLADLEVQAAQAALDSAQAALADVQKGPAIEALARERRHADLLREDADAAHLALQQTQQLNAPFDGIVASVDAQLGQAADAHTPVVRVVAAGALSVTASASESDVTHLQPGQSVQLTFPGLGEQLGEGTIAAVSVAATAPTSSDRNQVTYPVQVDLSSAPPELKLGMTAMLNLELRQAADVLYVPKMALRQIDGKSVLSVINLAYGDFSDAIVQVGGTYGTNVEILSGVNEGDTVAVIAPASGAGTVANTASP